MKYVVMLLLGLAIGAFAAVTAISALSQGTPLSKGVMSVMGHHLGALRDLPASGRCDGATIERHLRMLRAVSDDMAAGFLPTGGDDALFQRRIDEFSARADAALAAAPADCARLATVTAELGDGCKACHRDFRG